jgi:hypothetical protein
MFAVGNLGAWASLAAAKQGISGSLQDRLEKDCFDCFEGIQLRRRVNTAATIFRIPNSHRAWSWLGDPL